MAFAMLGLAPPLAVAEDVQDQLQQMQQRLQSMEDRLQATDDQLDAANEKVDEQQELIQSSGLAETRGASSGLGCFVCSLTIGGWVAGSYFYNINDPNDAQNPFGFADSRTEFVDEEILIDGFPVTVTVPQTFTGGGLGNTNRGLNQSFYPLHPDHNSFALDQIWFEIEKEISEENRGGFRADFVYGKTGALLGGVSNREEISDDTALYLYQGYVQYLAPIGDGLTFKAGKFATLIGVEVPGTIYNWNITRGQVWQLLEPIDHIGVLTGYQFGDSGFDFMLGGVNGFESDDPDVNDEKSVTGHIGWAGETVSVAVNGIWGHERLANDGEGRGTVNGIIRWNPSERFGMYLNGDYAWIDGGDDPQAYGLSLAGRYGITERTGIALRGEWVEDFDQFFGFVNQDQDQTGGFFADSSGISAWSITGTLDHLLTDQLMIRGEARYDRIYKDNGSDNEFFTNNNYLDVDDLENDQIVVGVELIYNFNKFGGE